MMMKKELLCILLVFCLIIPYGVKRTIKKIRDKQGWVENKMSDERNRVKTDEITELEAGHEIVPNLNNSSVYAAIMAADEVFEQTYVAQPNMLAPRKAAIVTCMDHRLNDFLGTVTKGTFVLRNAGARVTDDLIRSLIILYKLLGTEEIFLIQHTDCGMQKFTDEVIEELLQESLAKATLVKNCNETLDTLQKNTECQWENGRSCCGKDVVVDCNGIDWLTINSGLFESVLEDVNKIRKHPLIPLNIPVYGFIFDVITGDLIPVPQAMEAGKAKSLCCKS
jgi:carbonic anhydrase